MDVIAYEFILADIIAMAILIGALYARRHGRRDLIAAYIGINIGVLAITMMLAEGMVDSSLGLGLFGVLSIIRLRSTEISQSEIAYFFAALALGLLAGIQAAPAAVIIPLMILVLVAMWLGDHPLMARRNRHQLINLDRAIADEAALVAHLESLLGGRVRDLEVQELDLVNDTTLVDVRYVLPREYAASSRSEQRRSVSA